MNGFDDLLNNSPAEQRQGGQLSKEDYAAKKQAEREAIFELSDATAYEVSGDGDRFQQYLDVQSRFDRHSAVNALLIMAQKPEATRIGDFDYWKERGGFVRPGQTAISILEPHEYTKEDGTPGTGYNLRKVFDISQVDARRVKQTAPPTYTERQLLGALVSKAPMKISGADELPDGGGAYTDPDTGEISVLRGMAFADTFSSVAKELGYYEADRDANKIPLNPSLVGYCAAYMLCQKYGVDTQSFDFSRAPDVFGQVDAQGVKKELSIIRDAAEAISGRMAKQLDSSSRAALSSNGDKPPLSAHSAAPPLPAKSNDFPGTPDKAARNTEAR
jgi:hypothetical protein